MKAGLCKHFNGIQNDVCEKGIGYDKFRDGVRPVFDSLPCFGKCDGCDSREFPTAQDLADYEKEVDACMQPILCIDEQMSAGQTFGSFIHSGCGGLITWRVRGPLTGGAKCDKCEWSMIS